MVYRKISDNIKQRALFLTNHPKLVSSVEDALGVSTSSIRRWQANYDKYGSVSGPTRPVGRPRLMNGMERDRLRTFLIAEPEHYLDEIREWIAVELDIPMAQTTVYENIRECKLTRKKLQAASCPTRRGRNPCMEEGSRGGVLGRATRLTRRVN
jgi:transposase